MEVHQLQMLRELGDLAVSRARSRDPHGHPLGCLPAARTPAEVGGRAADRKEGRDPGAHRCGPGPRRRRSRRRERLADARAAIGAYHDSPGSTVTLSAFHSAGQALFAPLAALLTTRAMRSGNSVPRVKLADEDVAQEDFPAWPRAMTSCWRTGWSTAPGGPPKSGRDPARRRTARRRVACRAPARGAPRTQAGRRRRAALGDQPRRLLPRGRAGRRRRRLRRDEHRPPHQRLLHRRRIRGGRRRDWSAPAVYRPAGTEPRHCAASARRLSIPCAKSTSWRGRKT